MRLDKEQVPLHMWAAADPSVSPPCLVGSMMTGPTVVINVQEHLWKQINVLKYKTRKKIV